MYSPLTLKIKRRSKNKTDFKHFFKKNENRGGISLYYSTINHIFQTLVFIKIFGNFFLIFSIYFILTIKIEYNLVCLYIITAKHKVRAD